MAKITDSFMRSTPKSKGDKTSESLIHGHGSLIARITPSGERLFYFRYLDSQGKRIDYPIGSYPLNKDSDEQKETLKAARAKAMKLAELHESGIRDIREHLAEQERKKLEAEAEAERQKQAEAEAEAARLESERRELAARKTVGDLFDQWRRVKLAGHKDKGKAVTQIFEKDVLPEIGHLYAASISKSHITQVADRQIERGTSRLANRTFTLMRQMFRFALGREIITADPTALLSKADIAGKDTERDRVLTEDEIRELYRKMPDAGLLQSTELAVWIALSTCCRIGELSQAKWEHIDLEKRQWLIPAENSKNGKPHTVYLSAIAESSFRKLKALPGESVWCYPGRNDGEPVSPKSITKQLKDRQRRSDDERLAGRSSKQGALLLSGGLWTPHDLRRTAATMMVALGVLPETAERCLNHTEENKIKRIYQRHNYEREMRDAWRLLGERLDLLCRTDSGNVINFRQNKG